MSGEASKAIDKSVLWGGGRSPFSVSYGKMMMWFFLISDALTFSGLLIALGFAKVVHADEWPVGEKVFEALPFLGKGFPLVYVALMTFLLIISSVTMVLAVEAGHRNDRKAVTKWMILTVFGGFFFLGSQAWEWSHFIHGAGGYFKTTDGTTVYFDGHWLDEHMTGHEITGTPEVLYLDKFNTGRAEVTGAEAEALWAQRDHDILVHGAGMTENEYGHQLYANFFFFVTGFHGFHVFTGVLLNLIITIMVLRGVFEKRGHYEMVEKAGLYWHFVDLVWVFVFTFFYLI